jgi:hypothetical protein
MNFLHPPLTSYLSAPNIFLCTIFTDTLNLRSSLNVSDHNSHQYKQQEKLLFCLK